MDHPTPRGASQVKRRWLIPEVIQTSAMDCGPAALKSLMEGFGLSASYGRLREACHTEVDGTSIDTIEEIAQQLGLDASQVMVPADHLLLPEADILPCLVVVQMEGSGNHFLVAWRRHGPWLQVMDPAIGRRWMRASHFMEQVYLHEQQLPGASWAEWAKGDGMIGPLRARMRHAGVETQRVEVLISTAIASEGWQAIGALDAAVNLAQSLKSPSLVSLVDRPDLIPPDYWRVKDASDGDIVFKGAVAMQVSGVKDPDLGALPESLREALTEKPPGPLRELWQILRTDGMGLPAAAVLGAGIAAIAVLFEALFVRALFSLIPHFTRSGERIAMVTALVVFLSCLMLIEWATEDLLKASGRRLELRLRTRFCLKVPRLGDRYFQSRLISDMAQRAHAVQGLRDVPPLAINLLRSLVSMLATVIGVAWFFPQAAWQAVACAVVAIAVPVLAQPWLLERDLRFREHAGGLSRFYLDALLGIVPIRTHGAGPALRASQSIQLGNWAAAGLRVQRSVVGLETLQNLLSYGAAAWLVFIAMREQSNEAALILLVYWTLSLPEMGKAISATVLQWPGLRNGLLRFLEPLGAPEESIDEAVPVVAADRPSGVAIKMQNLSIAISGKPILHGVSVTIQSGEHIGIVGPSGAGKSSFVGLLLGWYTVPEGMLCVDGEPLNSAALHRLRRETAWVDPQVQLWNDPLIDNLRYGLAKEQALALGRAIDDANLSGIIQGLPAGLQNPLGEGGTMVSGGEGQRVRMARAFGKPGVRLAVLDEPARGLDRSMRDEFAARAREVWKDATLLCITHDVASTRAFPRVLVIEDGQLREDGDPAELYAQTGSRYRALCDGEDQVRDLLWNAATWRRIRMDKGQLTEEVLS
jgi:ABC-type bacteriocin/lantibiotic exporter with double-glycine peptidase domain